jgi:hypothetical protein
MNREESVRGRDAAGRPFPLGSPWRRLPAAPPRPAVASSPAATDGAGTQQPPSEMK